MRMHLQFNDECIRDVDLNVLKEAINQAFHNCIPSDTTHNAQMYVYDDIVGIVHQTDLLLNARAISINNNDGVCYAFGNKPDACSGYGIYYFYARPELKCYPGSLVEIPVTNYNNDKYGICVVKNPILKKNFEPKKSVSEVIGFKQLPYEIPDDKRTLFCMLYSAFVKNEISMSDIDKFFTEVIQR